MTPLARAEAAVVRMRAREWLLQGAVRQGLAPRGRPAPPHALQPSWLSLSRTAAIVGSLRPETPEECAAAAPRMLEWAKEVSAAHDALVSFLREVDPRYVEGQEEDMGLFLAAWREATAALLAPLRTSAVSAEAA